MSRPAVASRALAAPLVASLAIALAAIPSVAAAQQSQERFSADLSANAGYSNNPFSVLGDDTGSALVSVDIAPRYLVLTERSTLSVTGLASVQQYLRRYSRNETFLAAVDYQLKPSERVTAHTRLDFSSAVLGGLNNFPTLSPGTGGIGAGGAGTGTGTGTGTGAIGPVNPGLTDIGLFGFRNRRNLGRASGDASIGVSASDTLTLSTYAEVSRYQDIPLGDYEAYSASLGYSRRISERFNAGLRASASLFDYDGTRSDSRVFPIEATLFGRINALWTFDAALGATFVDGGGIGSTRRTSLSGSLNVCRQGQLSSMCAQASRQVTPTGLVGTQYITSAGLNWSLRLGERDSVSLGASYSDVGGGNQRLVVPGGLPLQTEFAQATAGYSRQLRERLRLTGSANYRQLLDGNAGRPADFGGQIGLSYRVGDPR